MSIVIDWSKAPAHATHWCPGNARIEEGWIYKAGQEFYSCYAEKSCEHIPSFPAWRALRLIPRPAEPATWNGKGFPPVGTVCELSSQGADWGIGIILYTADNVVVWRWKNQQEGQACSCYKHEVEIRQIRTPEQIEYENREAAITHIAAIMGKDPERPGIREKAAIIYDAGYRKVTP